ncbi:MAG: iron-containing alcohol dehydrogenase [Candidatus Omnitrophota bacterium]
MRNFVFHNPTRVYFGRGQAAALEEELRGRFGKVLLVTGGGSVRKNGVLDDVISRIKRAGAGYVELQGVCPNPRLESVYEGIDIARKGSVDLILPVGGGSVIDAAKAIAAGVPYEGDVWDFFEKGVAPEKALPVGTVLTLAATGSEMNSNAVITREDARRKLAMSSPLIQPVFSVLDPAYTCTVNRYHTAAGVADIMAHVFEYYFNPTSHAEVQDALAEALLGICVKFGPVVCDEPWNYDARANILWASSLALSGIVGRGKISDWTCHGIEHEISAICDISHGAGLAIILPPFMKVLCEKYGPGRIAGYGEAVWGLKKDGDMDGAAVETIERTRSFFDSLGLPSNLKEAGIRAEHIGLIAENTVRERAVFDDLIQLSEEDIRRVLRSALRS